MLVSRARICRLLPAIFAALLLLSACHRTDAGSPLAPNAFIGGSGEPTMLAAYMPWFGQPGHINVGYSSQDRVELEKQIDQAKQLGITAFVVNWYGQHHSFEDKAYALMQEVAAEKNFKVAIMYDEDDSDPATETDDIIADLQYAYDHYIGPQAVVPRDAYLTYNDRPLLLIFPKGGRVDWNRVRQAANGWAEPPLLIYKDIHPDLANDFDGFYAWVNPGKPGWQPNGSNWGQQYLRQLLQDHGHRLSQQDRRRRGMAGIQRFRSQLDSEPQDGLPLRPHLHRYHADVPPLLRSAASASLPHDRDLERLRGRYRHREGRAYV